MRSDYDLGLEKVKWKEGYATLQPGILQVPKHSLLFLFNPMRNFFEIPVTDGAIRRGTGELNWVLGQKYGQWAHSTPQRAGSREPQS